MLYSTWRFGGKIAYLNRLNKAYDIANDAVWGNTELISVRALVWHNGEIIQITDALLGTKKPLRFTGTAFIQALVALPDSVILSNGVLRYYNPATEQLIF